MLGSHKMIGKYSLHFLSIFLRVKLDPGDNVQDKYVKNWSLKKDILIIP